MNNKPSLVPTASQTVGPYLHLGLTDSRSVACLVNSRTTGERIQLTCRVFDGDNAPVPDAMIELWQADANGEYDSAESASDSKRFCGFGRSATNDAGACTFETIKPGRVPGPGGTSQAPHLNISVFGRGLLNRLATRIYFAGDVANKEDSVLALIPENRRTTLLCHEDPAHPGFWSFDIHLCGDAETVFFDV